MRSVATVDRIHALMRALGQRARGPGRVYLTGGASALLVGWRRATVDVDLRLAPEPRGIFTALRDLKDELDLNIELASPQDFLPELPGWQNRSPFICQEGPVAFHHYDFHAQALSKIARGHTRDLADVIAMVEAGLVKPARVAELFEAIRPGLVRFPALDEDVLVAKVAAFTARSPPMVERLDHLPGGERIARGLAEATEGRLTEGALLVAIAWPRLQALGLSPSPDAARIEDPELQLYAMLRTQEPAVAYVRYNALVRELSSFVSALELQRARGQRRRARGPV